MADGWELERGFEYHANFIYNRPNLKNKRNTNQDWVTSLVVVKFIVELMREWGCDRTYYHDRDALPGGNVFTEFFTTIKKSRYTIVIVTKGFVEDCWGMYKSQAAFIKLLQNSKSNRFIAVYVDIDDHHIPEELCTMLCMSFSANWRDEREEWNRLRNLIRYVPTPIQDTGRDLFPATGNTSNNQGIQQDQHHAGRHDLRSTINTELQHSQRNPTSGLQETQPPNLRRAGGNNVLADGPLNGNVLAENSTSSEESTTNSNRAPPDGEANATTSVLAQGQSSQTIQREDSVGTNVKRLVSNENQDVIYCSLNQTDVEADNQASGQLNSVDTRAPQMPLKLEQSMIKSAQTTPFSGQDFEQLNVQDSRLERLKLDDNDQDDSGLGLD